MKQDRILRQLDKMIASGRITEEEAAALRAAEGTEDFDRAVGTIQARHAESHMNQAVAAGDMTQDEADAYSERLRQGDHPKGLRARLTNHKRRANKTG
jgi:polyhydroxyalkanoate synthesis regulator phasin